MKIALITGVTGQDGSYLSEFLIKKKYVVHGIIRRSFIFVLRIDKKIIFCCFLTSNYNAKAVGSVRGAFGNAAHNASRLCTKLKPYGFVTKIRSSEAPLGWLVIISARYAPSSCHVDAAASGVGADAVVPPWGAGSDDSALPKQRASHTRASTSEFPRVAVWSTPATTRSLPWERAV